MRIVISVAAMIELTLALAARPQETPYRAMATLEQYLMADRQGEIALARSAAPLSISHDADVLILGRRGFESAARGTNGQNSPQSTPYHCTNLMSLLSVG